MSDRLQSYKYIKEHRKKWYGVKWTQNRVKAYVIRNRCKWVQEHKIAKNQNKSIKKQSLKKLLNRKKPALLTTLLNFFTKLFPKNVNFSTEQNQIKNTKKALKKLLKNKLKKSNNTLLRSFTKLWIV